MKRLLVSVLALNLAFLAWYHWRRIPPVQGIGADGELQVPCADLNGDQVSDLADAVHLLNWLFLGGTEPDCADRAALLARIAELEEKLGAMGDGETPCLPATGQRDVFGDAPGQDGHYQAGCPLAGRFVDGGDGTVKDMSSGLVWLKGTADVNGDAKVDDADAVNWFDALEYCEKLEFAGRDDWRLPNVRELQSIVDYGKYGPSLDPVFEALAAWYWSSTTRADDAFSAWFVDFSIGYVYRDASKANRRFVRAVRSGVRS